MQFSLKSLGHRIYLKSISSRRYALTVCKTKSTSASFPKAKKSYGQNFLKQSETAWQIAQGANLTAGSPVLEIGPGTGVLTSELLKHDILLTAIENDHALMEGLRTQFHKEIASGRMNLLQGDATRLDLRPLLAESALQHGRWKVVANLPFNISTEILKILLPMGDIISDVHVMLQAETAARLIGDSLDESNYRAMTALVEFYSTATPMMAIDRTKFHPQPHVDCQMVNFKLKQEAERPEVPSEKAFLHVLKVCFSSRRKTVRNNLRAVFPADDVIAAQDQLKMDKDIRPQELTADDFAALTQILVR